MKYLEVEKGGRSTGISELSCGEHEDRNFQKTRESWSVEATMEGNEKCEKLKEGNCSKKLGALKSFHSQKWRRVTITAGIKCARKSGHK